MIDLPDDTQGLRRTMQDIHWKIRFVERLEQEGHPGFRGERCSPRQVFNRTFHVHVPFDAGHLVAEHHMKSGAVEEPRNVESRGKAPAKIGTLSRIAESA